MTAKGKFRVYATQHHGDIWSVVLLRRARRPFDAPPPAAMGNTLADALARLAAQAALIADDYHEAQRYLWTEELVLRRVEIDIFPGRPDPAGYEIGKAPVPIRLGYAAARLTDSELYRVLIPRFDWSFVTEALETVPDTVRSLVFAVLIGDSPAELYDLKREPDEQILEWMPVEAPEVAKASADAGMDPAPTLEAVAEDWIAMARAHRLRAVVGVDAVFDASVAALLDEERLPSLLLVGPRGAGKTAMVRRIARAMLERTRGKAGRRRRLWATSADRIVAGMVYLGMWQQRCLAIAGELAGGEDVLYLDRLADAMSPMSDGASIADLLASAVIAKEVSVIAECDDAELVRARQKNPALLDAFRVIRVPELAPAHAIALLEPYGARCKPAVALSHDAARRLVELLAAFRRDSAFPGKALAFVDFLASRPGQSAQPGQTDGREVTLAEITEAFGTWSGLPVELLAPERALDTAAIAARLREGVIGQDAACAVAGRVIARLKAGLDDPQRPVGALLFAGPTGVGKTELAKQLARYLFGDAERLVRVDMSELMTPGAIQRLIAPSATGSSLADRIRRQPLSVVLFDEIEKADAAAFDLLLGVIGEGRLTDTVGRLVDFRMAVIVMTTNLGASDPRPAGFTTTGGSDHGSAIRKFFRPELLGRLDATIAFQPLARASLEKIVELELAKLRARPGLVARNLRLEMTPAARARLAELGYDPELGARPLRRTIEDLVVAPIAARMAATPEWRDATIRIACANEGGVIDVTLA